MPLEIVLEDITRMNTDAVVNAATSSLKMVDGVCDAIFNAAGTVQLQKACGRIGHCAVGEAVHTDAFLLDADFIIHTVGPIWEGGTNNEEVLMRNCYRNSLELAYELGCESISFPLISTGNHDYPKESAMQIAVSEIEQFLLEHEMHIHLVVFDRQTFGINEKLYQSISAFIDENEVITLEKMNTPSPEVNDSVIISYSLITELLVESHMEMSLEEIFLEMDESFSERLLRFIDEKGMTDTETYKKANIDRKLFSKIRISPGYTPLKKTVIAFAVALELDLNETEDLLGKAGYRLSNSHKFDLIIRYFLERKIYNIHKINEYLFAFDQITLGS